MSEGTTPHTTEHTAQQPSVEDTAALQGYADSLQADIATREEAIRELKRQYMREAKVNEEMRYRWVTDLNALEAKLAQLQATHVHKREDMQRELDGLQNQIDAARRIRDELTQLRHP